MTVTTWRGATAIAQLAALEPFLQMAGAPVTARSAWLIAAARAEVGREPVLLAVWRDDACVAAACLSVRRRWGTTSVELMGSGRADHARLPAQDSAAAQALADAIVDLLHGFRTWRLRLTQLPPDDSVSLALSSRIVLRSDDGVGCPVTEVNHDVPLAGQLSVNGRKSVRKFTNRLEADGHQAVASWVTGNATLRVLPEIQELRKARDHAVGRASEMDDPTARGFHTELVTAYAGDNRLELLRYHVDSVLAAYAIVVIDDLPDGRVLRVWDGRVASGYERYGVGWLTAVAVFERALADHSVRQIDWMRGEHENKQRIATGVLNSVVLAGESAPWLTRWDALSRLATETVLGAARRLVPPEKRYRLRALVTRIKPDDQRDASPATR